MERRMKKSVLALLMTGCMVVGNMFSAFAADVFTKTTGSGSVTTETVEKVETTSTDTEKVTDCKGKYVNIALVVDTTGSMSWDIRIVKENLTEFVREIEKSGAISRISLIEYKDIQCDDMDSTKVHTTPEYSVWFDDMERIIEEIATLEDNVTGGGDIPESLVDALGYVVNDEVMTFNASAAKFAIVLTDAGYNDANRWGVKNMDEMIAKLKEKDIQTSVVTHKNSYTGTWDDEIGGYLRDESSILLSDEYADLTSKTGGKIIDLSDDFAVELSEYAKDIIAKTASTEIDDSYIPVTGIELGDDVSVATDGTYKFPITITPANATVKDIIWSVEDESIATINTELTNSEYCVVDMLATGTTKLIAKTADGGYTAFFELDVKDVVIDSKTGVAETAKADKVAEVLETKEVSKVTLTADSETETVVEEEILKDIFTTLKSSEKKVEFSFKDSIGDECYSWTFDGKDITDTDKVIKSFKIEVGEATDTDVTKAINSAMEAAGLTDTEETATDVHFDHHGDLPGTATVKVKVDLTAENLYLYYFNPETGKLEPVSDSVKVVDGFATFEIEHCSDYVLATKDLLKVKPTEPDTTEPDTTEPGTPEPDTSGPGKTDPEKTGDSAPVALLVMAAAVSCATVVMSRKKKVQ